ncbi:MAG: flagellar M-ring protein FliF [Candidatus Desulfofervidaceae bacterium]|nr:flagellar M-ring protein FliF [Candidatus Desulfofervidaceae bacterium]
MDLKQLGLVGNKIKNLSLGQKIALGIILILFLSSVVVSLLWLHAPRYQLLYGNLNPEDAGAVINKLKEIHVSYQLKNGGRDIYVPQDKVYETRLQLASEGLPKGGQIGFEIFDRNTLGITDFVQKLNYQRALQGELARTISSLTEIKWARVHIVMPKESLFTEEAKKTSASVLLKLNPNQILPESQIRAITYLVASSVPELHPEDVVVVDTNGHMLAGGKKGVASGEWVGEKLKIQHQLETQLEQKVRELLERAVGPGKAIAKVSVEMDFSQIEKTQELYDPDQVVVRSEQQSEENAIGSETTPIGVPGVFSNLPQTQKQAQNTVNTSPYQQKKINKVINYEISKTVQHITDPMGKIKRISVAVLVDGIHKGDKYIPRSEEEMAKLKAIVEKAVGFSKARGDQIEVVNVPFDQSFVKEELQMEDTAAKLEKQRLWYRVIVFAFKGLVLLVLVFVLSRLLKNLLKPVQGLPSSQELPQPLRELEAKMGALPKTEDIEMLREELRRIAQKEPARIAQVAQNWLKESRGK